LTAVERGDLLESTVTFSGKFQSIKEDKRIMKRFVLIMVLAAVCAPLFVSQAQAASAKHHHGHHHAHHHHHH
jgi:hypothetical protein